MHWFPFLVVAALLFVTGCSGDRISDDDDIAGDDDIGMADDDDSGILDDDDSTPGGDDDTDLGDDDTTPGDDDDSAAGDDDDSGAADTDGDGDGWTVEQGDCDDGDASVFPGNTEIDCDGIDNDCSGGADWEVPADFAWIQDAIDAAADGDAVCIQPGTYIERLDFLGKAIRVQGVQGAEITIVDGFSMGTVVTFENGEGPDSVLAGLTITGGLTFLGGGIYIEAAGPTLTDLIVTENETTEDGGGIYACSGSEFTLSRSALSANVAEDRGAGLYAVDSQVTMSNLSIVDNSARTGGGVYLWDSVGELTHSTIEGNMAAAAAGGYAFGGWAFLDGLIDTQVLRNVWISSNTAGGCGGGLCGYGDVNMSDVTVVGNETTWDGGGLYLYGGEVVMENVLVTANEGDAGGGLYLEATQATLSNVILTSNTAQGAGGGLYLEHSGLVEEDTISLHNVSVVGNVASTGGGIGIEAGDAIMDISLVDVIVSGNGAFLAGGGVLLDDDDGTATFALQYCDVWNNTPDAFVGLDDPTGMDGNVSVDPALLATADPDPLAWDLHLSTSSPLVDAGDPTLLDPDGSPSDIGAYGGPAAGSFDLDDDGYPEWWQPGGYDFGTYPGLGWDCDDRDATTFPGSGC